MSFLEDGSPASGATIYVTAGDTRFPMHVDEYGAIFGSKNTKADTNGQFTIEYPGWDSHILIMHDKGLLNLSMDKLTNSTKLVLQPWGRVEGFFYVGKQIQKYVPVSLVGEDPAGYSYHLTENTDATGRFVFKKVPPVESLLYRNLIIHNGPIVQSHPVWIKVNPGETTIVNYGGEGCPVIGRVEGGLDMTFAPQLLMAKHKLSDSGPCPSPEGFSNWVSFEKARDAFMKTKGLGLLGPSVRSTYELKFSRNGSFRVEDVPPGIYDLYLRGYPPKGDEYKTNNLPMPYYSDNEIAWLAREVVVPDMPGGQSDTPLDLGTLKLNWLDPSHPGIPASPK